MVTHVIRSIGSMGCLQAVTYSITVSTLAGTLLFTFPAWGGGKIYIRHLFRSIEVGQSGRRALGLPGPSLNLFTLCLDRRFLTWSRNTQNKAGKTNSYCATVQSDPSSV